MAQVLVRNLEPKVVETLKARARANGRSLEAEVREILNDIARSVQRRQEHLAGLERVREMIGDRVFDDSAELIREDRDR